MTRRKDNGGRVTPKSTRPRNWGSGSTGGESGRRRPSRAARVHGRRPLFEVLRAISTQLAEMVPIRAGIGIPDRSGLASAVKRELGRDGAFAPTLAVMAELLEDDELRRLARRQLAALDVEAMDGASAVVAELRGAVAFDAREIREPFDEQRHFIFGVRFPGGEEMSVLVLVDVAGGLHLADGFIIAMSPDEIREVTGLEEDLVITDTSPGEIRRLLDDAIGSAHRTLPPPMTATWPDNAALIEWAVGRLPAPTGPDPEWEALSDADQEAFIEAFLASRERESVKLVDDTVIDVVSTLLWFKDGYTNGDLYRWGPNQVEMLLGDWALRKVIGDDAGLHKIPKVLRGLIPWCHRRIGLAPRHTALVLEVVDDIEPFFLKGLRPGRLKGVDALIAGAAPYLEAFDDRRSPLGGTGGVGGTGSGGVAHDDFDDAMTGDDAYEAELAEWWARRAARRRVEAVGGVEELKNLTAEPLPGNEMASVDGLPDDLQPRAAEVATEAMRVAGALYGAEYGTAAARLAVRLAEADPKALARGKPESAVAALVWMVASANGGRWSTYLVDIQKLAGTKANPKDRARTFTRALGHEYTETDDLLLGSAELLVSQRRRQIIEAEAADPGRHDVDGP